MAITHQPTYEPQTTVKRRRTNDPHTTVTTASLTSSFLISSPS